MTEIDREERISKEGGPDRAHDRDRGPGLDKEDPDQDPGRKRSL